MLLSIIVAFAVAENLLLPVQDAQYGGFMRGYSSSAENVDSTPLFDGDVTTEVFFGANSGWATYVFPYPVILQKFDITAAASLSQNVRVEVSGDNLKGESSLLYKSAKPLLVSAKAREVLVTGRVPFKRITFSFSSSETLHLAEIGMFGDIIPAPKVSQKAVTWTDLGEGKVAVGADCPFLSRGPYTSLEACEAACMDNDNCNVINFYPKMDCVFRSCKDPNNPQLSTQAGYTAYTSGRPLPGPPCSSGTASTCGKTYETCHCEWNGTACAISKGPYPLPSNSSLLTMTSSTTYLQKNMRFAFYGDSITWLGFYENTMSQYLHGSPTTNGMNITLINRGINGGTVTDLVAGFSPWGKSIAYLQALETDQPTVAAIQIGINDVWQADRGNNLTYFSKVLSEEIIKPTIAKGIKIYIASVTTIGEKRDGQNPYDAQLDAFRDAQKEIAASFKIPFVDLRKNYQDYDLTNNCLDLYNGVITYDGVHPTVPVGSTMLANSHAGGIQQCL